jgi:predicted dithiol-disulfide oxidoreductase (DUF899 family)
VREPRNVHRSNDACAKAIASFTRTRVTPRGGNLQLGTYNWLDLTALGRQEDWEQPSVAPTVRS